VASAGKSAKQGKQRVAEDGVWHAGLDGIRAPHRDGEAALCRLLDHRGRETRLPDAALAAENDGPAATLIRILERGRERRQLRFTPHERRGSSGQSFVGGAA
jgi:hypothetical protein